MFECSVVLQELKRTYVHMFLPLNDPDTPTLLHRSSSDISFAPSSLAFSCSWEVLHHLRSDHLPILLSVSLRPIAPTSVLLPSIFRKLAGMTLPPTVHWQRNTRLFLFPLLLLSSHLSGTQCSQIFHSFRPH